MLDALKMFRWRTLTTFLTAMWSGSQTRFTARTIALAASSSVVVTIYTSVAIAQPLPKLLSEEDYNCLVEAVYYEASTEELIGKIAVANVILNRVKADNFPKTICGVVHDKQVKRRGSVRPVQCAFQYHCQRKTYSKIPKDRLVEVHLASYLALNNVLPRDHENALFFYSGKNKPYWVKDKVFISRIGNHSFYEERSKT